SPELALAATAAPVVAGRGGARQEQRGGGPPIAHPQQQQSPVSGRGVQSNPVTAGQAPGGVLGVVSKSKATSLRIYNNHDKYNEWVFTATQMSVQAGGGATGDQAPGGRGGQPLGGGTRGDGRGRRGEPDSPNGPSGFGQPFQRGGGPGPGGNPGGFGGPGTGQPFRPRRREVLQVIHNRVVQCGSDARDRIVVRRRMHPIGEQRHVQRSLRIDPE